MQKYYKYILPILLITVIGCSSKISLSGLKYGSPGYSMFGENPARRFYVPVAIKDSLRLKWQAEINGSFGNTSVTISQDYVFVPDQSGRVFVFDINNGKELGQVKNKGSVDPAPLIFQQRIIFAVNEYREPKATVYNYDYQNGKVLTEIETDGNIKTELLRTEEDIYFITEQGKACKYNTSGNKLWEYETKEYVHCSPAMSNGVIVYGTDKGNIVSLSASSGSIYFKKKIGSGFEGGLTISGDTVLCADNNGTVYCLDLKTGDLYWKFSTGYRITAIPVTDGKSVYIGNLRGILYKIDKSSGTRMWKLSTKGVLDVTPLLFENMLIQPDLNKNIYFIDTKTGLIKKTMEVGDRAKLSPVYFNNMLFLGIDKGQVLAYEIVNDNLSSR